MRLLQTNNQNVTLLLTYLALFLSLLYAGLLFYIVKIWKKELKKTDDQKCSSLPFLTILIPARNEVSTIIACINSILKQDYPQDKMELIVIDDHSNDGTAEIVNQLEDSRVKLLKLAQFIPKNSKIVAYKKAALNLGIKQAKGTFIITTDADCIAPKAWLKSYAAAFQNGKEMVLGAVRINDGKGFLTAFQDLDVAGTMLLTGAAVFAKHPILSNGANFGFSKYLFDALGGYSGNENQASGDDIFLLQKATRKYIDKIVFLSSSSALVETTAATTWGTLFWQRLRWAGKTSAYQDFYLIGFQGFVFLLNIFLWGESLAYLLGFITTPFIVLAAWLIKLLADFFYLRFATSLLGQKKSLLFFLPAFIAHSLYIIGIGTLALLPISSTWKGRSI